MNNSQETNQSSSYDLRNTKFGGGFAAEGGTQSGGTLNDYSTNVFGNNAEQIAQVLSSLKESAKAFTDTQRQDIELGLKDLERDLKSKEAEPAQINQRLKGLLAKAMAALLLVLPAAEGLKTFSEVTAETTGNLVETVKNVKVFVGDIKSGKTVEFQSLPESSQVMTEAVGNMAEQASELSKLLEPSL